MTDRKRLPIAVIDSGVGGISVLSELIRLMPNENYIYFGDSANAPYGTKSRAEVLKITENNVELLINKGIKAAVIACNTATSAAAKAIREKYPSLIVIGIEPAIKPAAELCAAPRVLVMATPLTLNEEKFCALAKRFSDKEEIIPLPCDGLSELVERGELSGEVINTYLDALFAPYKDEKIDAIVLGCTHYPHVKAAIAERFGREVAILDGGEGTARETRRRLEADGLLCETAGKGSVEIINTSGEARLIELSRSLLNKMMQ